MMLVVRIVAGLHLAAYLGIMWYGWKSYNLLRKQSWRYMGVGFFILLLYRTRQFIAQMLVDYRVDTGGTLFSFVGAVFLLVAFRMLWHEHHGLINKLSTAPGPIRSGAQPVEFWSHFAREQAAKTLESIRLIVREEIAAASGTTTVTVKGPAAVLTEPTMETPPPK